MARKPILGVLLVPDQGRLNVLKTHMRGSNVVFGELDGSDLAIVISNAGIRV